MACVSLPPATTMFSIRHFPWLSSMRNININFHMLNEQELLGKVQCMYYYKLLKYWLDNSWESFVFLAIQDVLLFVHDVIPYKYTWCSYIIQVLLFHNVQLSACSRKMTVKNWQWYKGEKIYLFSILKLQLLMHTIVLALYNMCCTLHICVCISSKIKSIIMQ